MLRGVLSNSSISNKEELEILKNLKSIPPKTMDIAISHNRIDVIEYLLSIGIKVTSENIRYASCFKLNILKLFISNGYSDRRMLSFAMKRGHPEIIEYLLENGYKPAYSDIYEACINLKEDVIFTTCGFKISKFNATVRDAMETNSLDKLVKRIIDYKA